MDPEELELQNDYRYRSYAAVIEKALRNFESSSEWADLISSLGKLNKVLYDPQSLFQDVCFLIINSVAVVCSYEEVMLLTETHPSCYSVLGLLVIFYR